MSPRGGKPEGRAPATAHRSRGQQQRQLRIIAGRWRGRRWRFPPSALRPTPDRVRETLFNWLQGRTEGAHCLDLFAGSGALGLEALSRGAASVTFVEHDRAAASSLEALLLQWQAGTARVICAPAQQFLERRTRDSGGVRAYDLVFLDPPFASGELAAVMAQLGRGWLAPAARIYVEHAQSSGLPALPAGWHELRAGSAGQVGYHLLAPAGGATA